MKNKLSIGLLSILLVISFATPLLILLSADTALAQTADHVVISEFTTRGPNGAYDEFVELYNPTDQDIDIGGWKFQYALTTWYTRHTIPAGHTIQAHGFYLMANVRANGYVGPPDPDSSTSWSGLADTDRSVRIVDASNNVVDLVGYGSGANYYEGSPGPNPPSPGTGGSVERKPGHQNPLAGNGTDTDNNENDFITRDSREPQNSENAKEPAEERGVVVSISPKAKADNAGENLTFTVTVKNTGNVAATYNLENTPENTSWLCSRSDNSLTIAGLSENTTTLTVTIPAGVKIGDSTYVTVTATDNENASITDNDNCWAVCGQFAPDLFISEYVEGSSYNKAIEIYNGTGVSVDLSGYELELYSNGASYENRKHRALSGTVTTDNVWVGCAKQAGDNLKNLSDWVEPTQVVINWNGDDGIVLRKISDNSIVDCIGKYENDPGTEWPGGGKDDTQVRKSSIGQGDDNFNDDFDFSVEWDSYLQDDFSHLGSHTWDNYPVKPPGVDVSISPEFKADENGKNITYTVTVKNTGSVSATYNLENTPENTDWTCSLSPTSLTIAGKSENTTTLTVTIPAGAEEHDSTVITVTAKKSDDENITDNDDCWAVCETCDVFGKVTAYSYDQGGPEPWDNYQEGEYPSITCSEDNVGDNEGRVVAAGFAATCRNDRWDDDFKTLVDNIFAWLVKENRSNDNVLWYTGHKVYNDNDECSNLIDNLEALGWEITADNFEPITTDNLENYDIVVIPQLQEGDPYTGGDSTQLLDSELDNLENFVNGGKGLLVLESSDYGGHNYNLVQNRILGKFACCCYFQNDQVNDDTSHWDGDEYKPVAWVNANNWIGEAYENFENTCGVNLYSVCSLAEVVDNGVVVSISPSYDGAENGKNITFRVVVTNTGKDKDNFTLTVDNQWKAVLSSSATSLLDPWEAENLTLTVTVPDNAKRGDSDKVTVTAKSVSDPEENDNYYCTAVCGWLKYDVHGEKTAYNIDLACQEPWRYYPKGSLPPIMASKDVVSGRAAAAGFASTCADNQWSENENFHVLVDNIFNWLVKGWRTYFNDVLWYTGHGVYYDNVRCKQLIDNLKALGWTITAKDNEPITAALLSPYDIVVIPQLREGDPCTGGDPTLLLDSEVDNLESFVETDYKGLLVLESSDYGGYNYNRVQNKILAKLGFDVYFQNDEVVDYTSNWDTYYKPVVWVYNTGAGSIGYNYQTATGDNEVGLYGVCSLAESADNGVIVSISPKTKSENTDNDVTFNVIVTNSGKDQDNFVLTVDNQWKAVLPDNTSMLGSWGSQKLTLTVTVPSDASYGDYDKITVTATSESDNTVSDSYYCTAVCVSETYDVHGKENAYTESCVYSGPCKEYVPGSYPPIATHITCGNGRAVAAGFVATCKDNNWRENENFHVLIDNIFNWLVKQNRVDNDNVLWYTGHEVYYNSENCKQLIDNLENLGWEITADNTEPITSALLSPYDIVVIPQLRAPLYAGWYDDPDNITDDEVSALKSFAENENRGLLVLDGSDYGNNNYNKIQNKILRALGFPILFQDDQVLDNTSNWGANYKPIAVVKDTGDNSISDFYQAATGDNQVWLYRVCSLAAPCWENKADAPADFDGEHSLWTVGAGDNIYILQSDDGLAVYTPSTDNWTPLVSGSDLPFEGGIAKNGCAMAWDNKDNIFILEGGSYADDNTRKKFFVYHISDNTFDTLENTPYQQGAGDALAWVENGGNDYIYATLGTTSPLRSSTYRGIEFHRYNVASGSWENIGNPITPGSDDGASLVWTGENYLYAFPGAYEEGLDKEDETHFKRYDIQDNTWTELASTPTGLYGGVDDGGSLVWLGDNYLYALKGGDNGGGTPAGDFWRYSITGNSWERLCDVPRGPAEYNGCRLGVAGGENIYYWRGYGDLTFWKYEP